MAADELGLAATERSAWPGFGRWLVATATCVFLLLVGALLLVDPYDTGRTGILSRRGLADQYPFTANASRARAPRFDAAIFGNSHVQELRPERLDALTGLSFVSLMMPATWPADGLDVLGWFMRNRQSPPRALVIGIDQFWCWPGLSNSARFPSWLYASSFPRYLSGLVRWRAFEAAAARIRYARSGKGGYRPDGYWDYGPIYDKLGLSAPEPSYAKLATRKPFPVNESGSFPPIDRLRETLATLPRDTAVILLRTPVYRTGLPEPDTAEGRTAESCRAALAAAAASRPRTAFLDLFEPGSVADDRDNFYDHDHYRDRVAVEIEREVAAVLARLRS